MVIIFGEQITAYKVTLRNNITPPRIDEYVGFMVDHCKIFCEQTALEVNVCTQYLAPERVEMIVVAIILIRVVLQKAGLNDIYTSAYAMKEGMLEELAAQVFK